MDNFDDEFKELNELEKLKKDVRKLQDKLRSETKTLKGRITKVSNRVDEVELHVLQDQISRLGDDIKEINKNFLSFKKIFALSEINSLYLHMTTQIAFTLISDIETANKLKSHLQQERAKMIEKVGNSKNPFNIMIQFRKECIRISDNYHLSAFYEVP